MFDFEPIMDPIFYETEINRLKDPHGQANFFFVYCDQFTLWSDFTD